MADAILSARGAFAGLDLPLSAGGATLSELAWDGLASLMPFRGQEGAVAAALGLALPAPGGTAEGRGLRLLWAGRSAWMASGVPGLADTLAARLRGRAAVTDQTDAWCGLRLSGPAARAVLARLCPLDLDAGAFPDGATARTDLAHVAGQITRAGEGFELMVPRSYAGHLHHELHAAMVSVAAQAGL